MKIARANSIHTRDVGIEREVTCGIHPSRKSVVITRYYTQAEIERKRQNLLVQGKSVIFIPGYMTQHLSKRAVKAIINQRQVIQDRLGVSIFF